MHVVMLSRLWAWFRRPVTRSVEPAMTRAIVRPQVAPLTLDDVLAIVSIPSPGLTAEPEAVAFLAQRILFELDEDAMTIPAFPSAVTRVLELARDPHVDLNALVRALHWEPATVALIVKLANSAHFGARKLDDLRSAVLALGLIEVGSIAAAVSANALFEPGAKADQDVFPHHWIQAHVATLAVAFTAGWLAQERKIPRYDRVFLRGVITGASRSLALRALARSVVAKRSPLPNAAEIDAALDAVRGPVYDRAVERWALPDSVASVIDPTSVLERTVVELVIAVAELRRCPYQHSSAITIVDRARALGLDTSWLRSLVEEHDRAVVRAREVLGARTRVSHRASEARH